MGASDSKPKHTPGPWDLDEDVGTASIFGIDGFDVAEIPTYSSIHRDFRAGLMGDGHWGTTPGAYIRRTEDEALANARLIAASPDLLTQLTGLLAATRLVINAVDIDPETTNIDFRANGQPIAKVMLSTLLANADAAIRLALTGERDALGSEGR